MIASANIFGQGETPLVREGVKWLYELRYPYSEPPEQQTVERYYLYFDGTETIDNIRYSKCFRLNVSPDSVSKFVAHIRQEGGKVYSRITDLNNSYPLVHIEYQNLIQDKECLIYDFSLNAGESWKLIQDIPDHNSLGACANMQKVDSVGSAQFGGKAVKVQYVHSFSWAYENKTTVIEGIGCIYDGDFTAPYVPEAIPLGTADYMLRLVALEDSEGNVIYTPSGVKGVMSDKAGLNIEGDYLTVEAEGDWSLTVFSVDGSKAGSYRGFGPQTIEMPFAKGLYIAVLTDRTGSRKLKFMI